MTTAEHAVVDPEALKGLAHPLRLRLIAELNARGSATSSELGESSGSTDCHLRQLHPARLRGGGPRPGHGP